MASRSWSRRHTLSTPAQSDALSFHALLIGLALIYLLLHVPFLDRVPPIVVDEPWYANTAHNLADGRGLVNTNVGRGGGDQFFLYPLLLAGFFKLFGTSLWVGRFASVLIGLIGLWGWGVLCRKLALQGWALVVTGALFIISNVYLILFHRGRPEALVIALSVWALYFFITTWQTSSFKSALACALLVGGSALAHPFGALLAVLFGVLLAARALFSRDGARSLLGYAAGGVGTTLIFLIGWEFLRDQSLSEFIKALIDSKRHSVAHGSILPTFWSNLTTFLSGYSLGFKRLYILVFELGVLLIALVRYRHDRLAGLLSITGLLWFIVGLALWTPFKRWAFSIVLMFALAVTGRLLNIGITTISPNALKTLWLATLLYGLNNLAGDAYVLKENATNTAYTRLSQTLDAAIPDDATVLTHLEFWFAFQKNRVYTPYSYSDVRELLENGHIRYVILSAALARGFSPTTRELKITADSSVRFFEAARLYTPSYCQRIATFSTRGYGEIEIWECPPRAISS